MSYAIDGAVLQVILRKAEAIRKATGISVPMPEDSEGVTSALMQALLLRAGGHREQLAFDFGATIRDLSDVLVLDRATILDHLLDQALGGLRVAGQRERGAISGKPLDPAFETRLRLCFE